MSSIKVSAVKVGDIIKLKPNALVVYQKEITISGVAFLDTSFEVKSVRKVKRSTMDYPTIICYDLVLMNSKDRRRYVYKAQESILINKIK